MPEEQPGPVRPTPQPAPRRPRGGRAVAALLAGWALALPVLAGPLPEALRQHSVPAWVVDPADGTIHDANAAAVAFYGYPDLPYGRLNVTQINQLSEADIRAEMARAREEGRGYYLFPHRLADGRIVTVEVHSSPIRVDGRELLLSLLLPESRSVTLQQELQRYQTRLESLVAQRTEQVLGAQRARNRILGGALAVAAGALVAVSLVLVQLRRALRRERALASRLEDVLHGARLGYGQWDLVHDRITLHPRLLRLLGERASLPPLTSAQLAERLHPDDRRDIRDAVVRHLKGLSEAADLRFRVRHADGHWIWVQAWGRVTARDPASGRALTMAGVIRDVGNEVALEQSRAIALSVFQDAGEAIVVTDERGVVLEVNEAMVQLSGYPREELIGRGRLPWRPVQRHGTPAWPRLRRLLLREGRWRGEAWWRHRDGRLIPVIETISAVRDEAGRVIRYVALAQDISALKAQQQALEHQAFHDTLTGLPNRALLADRLALAIATAHRHQRRVAVAYLDLDGFKDVNDRHGHPLGDAVLREIALRLQRALREGDTLARVGGDEFVAVLADLDEGNRWQAVVERLMAVCAEPVTGLDADVHLTTSIGVTLYPDDGADAEVLLRHADQALYRAKREGKNRWVLFDPAEDREAAAHAELVADVRRGLAAGEFELHLQPRVRLSDGAVLGAEGLLRWRHPRDGLRLPGSFLPAIEQDDVMIELGEWVLHEALRLLAAWRREGRPSWQLSINVAARQLRDPAFADRLEQALQQHPEAPPAALELEIVESSALEGVEALERLLARCRALGVGVAIDDFGTGYSSLAYLKRLPATVVKIDQSFVRDIFDDPSDLRIIEGIVALGHAFDLEVVGEGVETVEHGALLLRLGADVAQGWGIARAMPPAQWPDWVAGWRTPPAWRQWAALVRSPWARLLVQAEIHHRTQLARAREGEPLGPPHACPVQRALREALPASVRSGAAYARLEAAHEAFHATSEALRTAAPLHAGQLQAIEAAHHAWLEALRELLASLALPSPHDVPAPAGTAPGALAADPDHGPPLPA
ncbi:Cyclic di-GMP phosphodiesterase Gmr [Tepidimonas sediminis]|uniref:Cyclic di-GMP phosphodiesterase Gmr n=1 Tax=Tepidimonas sediminis TaxID=2588941 RepID=A0A554WNZ2_9BURK|nr:EAL domain-containing protein [Tepidimonas sediminis]TSE25293.1 Cyclic di-GMP phosphodiesterase Gmr [Tepidimonas sediminis]